MNRQGKDIHKIDNVLLAAAKILAIVALFGGGCISLPLGAGIAMEAGHKIVDSKGGVRYDFSSTTAEQKAANNPGADIRPIKNSTRQLFLASIIGINLLVWVAVLGLYLTGRRIRKKEDKIIALWNALERSQELSLAAIERSMAMDRAFVLESVELLRRRHLAYYVVDTQNDTVVDMAVYEKSLAVDKCPSCGAAFKERLSFSGDAPPQCPYCQAGVAEDLWQRQRDRMLERVTHYQRGGNESEFSIGKFIVLFMLFWPAALAYAVKKHSGR